MRQPLIAGNWKMNKTCQDSAEFIQTLAKQALPSVESGIAIAASPTLLETLRREITTANVPVLLLAQTMESKDSGAYTGEVSPLQLKDIGADGVLIGHSERRQYYAETNETVNEKTKAALAHDLLPVICVGETLEEREAGQTDAVVREQTIAALKDLSAEQIARTVVAYEPVWAIGTGKVCEAAEAGRVCGVIRQQLSELSCADTAAQVRILYGGSMKPANAEELIAQADIDGGLIGGASLEVESFYSLIQTANTVNA